MFLLFVVAFIAATVWPMASEAYVSFLIADEPSWFMRVWFVATCGNSLGSIAMFEMAKLSSTWINNKKILHGERWLKSQHYIERYGSPVLFFTWLPIIGDILPLVAGALNFHRVRVYSWLILGKAVRYGVVVWATLSLLENTH